MPIDYPDVDSLVQGPPGVELQPIPGVLGYCAGSDGNVYSFRRGGRRSQYNGTRYSLTPKVLKPTLTNSGRLVLRIRQFGRYVNIQASRSVASAFHGPCPDGLECSHLDGNALNNKPCNLVWETRAENMARVREHGTRQRGETHSGAKLTEDEVREILEIGKQLLEGRENRRPKGSVKMAAKRFGVSPKYIDQIWRGGVWEHIRKEI